MLDFRLLAFWSTGTCVSVLEQMAKNKGIGERLRAAVIFNLITSGCVIWLKQSLKFYIEVCDYFGGGVLVRP